MKTHVKTLSYSENLLKSQLSKNLNRAITIIRKECKGYNPSDYSCGFRFMDNGSIVSQIQYGSPFAYSKEKYFTIGNQSDWKKILFQESISLLELNKVNGTNKVKSTVKFILDRYFKR